MMINIGRLQIVISIIRKWGNDKCGNFKCYHFKDANRY